ncbi:hypothetical protein M446_6460 [Methylobacterium sp. 4-46]|nr:hypothetical protein M446_6460 [Methylobacterium sp. 4-46]
MRITKAVIGVCAKPASCSVSQMSGIRATAMPPVTATARKSPSTPARAGPGGRGARRAGRGSRPRRSADRIR